MNDGAVLKAFIEKNNVDISDLAKRIGLHRTTIYTHFEREEIKNVVKEKYRAAFSADPFVENVEKTATSSNPRLEAIPTRLYADPLDYDDKSQRIINLPDGTMALRVPIVPARAYAGYMRGFADPEYYDDLEDILIGVDREPGGTYIGFEVVGDSMVCLDTLELADESIFPGRIAIARDLPQENWKTRLHTHNYKNWVFVHKTEGILIKQIASHDIENGRVTIHSLNPKYPDEVLLLSDMQQIFSVMQVVQRTRTKLK